MPSGGQTSSQPVFKAALVHLRRAWPQAVPFGELLAAARADAGGDRPAADDGRALAEGLLNCYATASGSLVMRTMLSGERLRAMVASCMRMC